METPVDMRNWIKLNILIVTRGTQLLRRLFRNRWLLKTGVEWDDSVQSGKSYISGVGVKVYNLIGKAQKTALEQGNCNDWDLKTLVAVLKNSEFPQRLSAAEENKIKKENSKAEKLRHMRNKFAHHPSQIISNQEFEQIWKKISAILISLGEVEADLDKLKNSKEESGIEFKDNVDNSNDNEKVKEANSLKALGITSFTNRKYSEAVDYYTQAIAIQDLPERHLAILYSYRSSAYLKKYSPSNEEDCRLYAKHDAKKVIELWSDWWKAYYQIGNVYHSLNKLDKAITAFDTALALAPTNEDVRNAQSACRQKRDQQTYMEHLDSRCLDQEHTNFQQKPDPVLETVWIGHQHYKGEGVPQNYENAAKYYGKAASEGNVEAMYNLAMLHKYGKGVMRDAAMANYLLDQAASSLNNLEGSGIAVGVSEAEHALGLNYEEGFGVKKNFANAASWYAKAVEHRNKYATYNLGVLYMNGRGVDRDLKRAEELLQSAVSSNIPDAMNKLANVYLLQLNPELALEWHHCSVKQGSDFAKLCSDDFENEASEMIQSFEAHGVPEWERRNHLKIDGLNQEQRLHRMNNNENFSQKTDCVKSQSANMKSSTMEHKKPMKFTDPSEPAISLTADESANSAGEVNLNNSNIIRQSKLLNPLHKEIIKYHREYINGQHKQHKGYLIVKGLTKQQQLSTSLVGLQPIFFRDMIETNNHIYSGYVLDVTIIDIPCFELPSIFLVVEDNHQDIQLTVVYNFNSHLDSSTKQKFDIGCKLFILNPCLWVDENGKTTLLVEGTHSVISQSLKHKIERICRYCGKGNSPRNCSRCNVAKYCSKECEEHDWKHFGHKNICFPR